MLPITSKHPSTGRVAKGFIDAMGNIAVAPKFDEVLPYSEGLAAVRLNERWGFINENGKVVIPLKWLRVGSFSEGLAVVVADIKQLDESEGQASVAYVSYVDRMGTVRIGPVWAYDAGPMRGGRARLMPYSPNGDHGRSIEGGFFDRSGKRVFAVSGYFGFLASLTDFSTADFSDGFALLPDPTNGQMRFVDHNGAILALPHGWTAVGAFSEGLGRVEWSRPSHAENLDPPRTGFIDTKGNLVFSLPAYAQDFHEGRAVFHRQRNGPFGYIDRCGTVVVPATLRCAQAYSEDLAVVCDQHGDRMVIDRQGSVFHKAELDIDASQGGLFRVLFARRTISGDGSTSPPPVEGYMNRQGQYLWLSDDILEIKGTSWVLGNYVGPIEQSPLLTLVPDTAPSSKVRRDPLGPSRLSLIRYGYSILLARILSVKEERTVDSRLLTTLILSISESWYGPSYRKEWRVVLDEPPSEFAKMRFPNPTWGETPRVEGTMLLVWIQPPRDGSQITENPAGVIAYQDNADFRGIKRLLDEEAMNPDRRERRARYLTGLLSPRIWERQFAVDVLSIDDLGFDTDDAVADALVQAFRREKNGPLQVDIVLAMARRLHESNPKGRAALLMALIGGARLSSEDVRSACLDSLDDFDPRDVEIPPILLHALERFVLAETDPQVKHRLKRIRAKFLAYLGRHVGNTNHQLPALGWDNQEL